MIQNSDGKNIEVYHIDKVLSNRGEKAFSIYKDVIVQWDQDYDARIFDVIDQLDISIRQKLLRILERKASLYLLWKSNITHIPKIKKGYGVTYNDPHKCICPDGNCQECDSEDDEHEECVNCFCEGGYDDYFVVAESIIY